MSLLATSSPYQSSQMVDSSKKKIPTIRKTIKKPQFLQEHVNIVSPSEEIRDTTNTSKHHIDASIINNTTDDVQNYHYPTTFIHKETEPTNTRFQKVSSLLEQMTNINVENDGNQLTTFQPIELPTFTQYHHSMEDVSSPQSSTTSNTTTTSTNKPILKPPKTTHQYAPIRNPSLSEYQTSYEVPTFTTKQSSSSETFTNQERLWDRIGYIIHLLEQQQNERTDTVLEEYVLYVLLGVFMIFICDSFAKSGRYIRT